MHHSDSRIDALQQALQNADIDLFLLPMSDEFQGEYIPESARRLTYISGFDGSSGVAAFWAKPTAEHPHTLFVDGRYVLQAPKQVSNRITVINSGSTSPTKWLEQQHSALRIGFDPWLITHQQLTQWKEAAPDKQWVPLASNPVDTIWENRPAPPTAPITLHPQEFAGKTYHEKRQLLLDYISQRNADAQLLTLPDGINWLLNIRGGDIPFNPLLLAYFLLYKDGRATLMLHQRQLDDDTRHFFREHHIELVDLPHSPAGVSTIASHIHEHCKPSHTNITLLIDPSCSAEAWWQIAEKNHWKLIETTDPTLRPKACKNAVELSGIKSAHIRDGVALTRFLCWIDGQVASRKLPTELEIADTLESFRARDPSYRGPSFATIAGSGPNGAIVHYRANETSNRQLKAGELLLLDSGGQYVDGTTDVTRTIAIVDSSDEMRERFTRVLKGHIALATARFPTGTTGTQLDVLARQYLWQVGLDYDHGTGHGVGAYLCVHEGPQSISKKGRASPLEAGMILSNEPGYYKADAYGIRIENLVTVTEHVPASQTAQEDKKTFLGFETITSVPIDTRLIDATMLTNDEHNWLNTYHRKVYDTLAPHMDKRELAWLQHATRAI